jgi:hypothetical protein
MLRRLFFLFPTEEQTHTAVDELLNRGIRRSRIHAISNTSELHSLPEATARQRRDTTFKLEKILWAVNLVVFALALMVLLVAIVNGMMLLIAAAISVMVICFFAGEQFVVRVPDVHLTEFTDALSHGEILLMIDVPLQRVAEIEELIHYNHPEAVVGGVGWTVDAFGM